MTERKGGADMSIDLALEERVSNLLSKLSLDEKCKQMSGDYTWITGMFKLLSVPMGWSAHKAFPAGENTRLDIPPILFTDGPRGIIYGENSTCFPVPSLRSCSFNVDLEREIGKVFGLEARALGANLFAGICMNLIVPNWGRAQESFSESSFLTAEFAAACVSGVQKYVMACCKHFCCNNIENTRFKVDVKVQEYILRELYLPHFKRVVDEGVASIMSSYNKVNGQYMGENAHLLKNVLKNEWKFDGFVMSDFVYGTHQNSATNGLDLEMPIARWFGKTLVKKVEESRAQAHAQSEARDGSGTSEISIEMCVNDSVRRILRQKLKWQDIDVKNEREGEGESEISDSVVGCDKHVDLAYRSAAESIVLLKNQNDTLPISVPSPASSSGDEKQKHKICVGVCGKLAARPVTGDHGSSNVRLKESSIITPLMGIQAFASNLGDGSVSVVHSKKSNGSELRDMIQKSDYILLCVGNDHNAEGENIFFHGGDRNTLELDQKDMNLIEFVIKCNSNADSNSAKIIVVLIGGSSFAMNGVLDPDNDDVHAVLFAGYSGMCGGKALADILFGSVNPSGHLSVSFPRYDTDLPLPDTHADSVVYGRCIGFEYLDLHNIIPAYAFGHGLSYGCCFEFEFGNITSFLPENSKEKKKFDPYSPFLVVEVYIKNTGTRDGTTVAQVYIQAESQSRNGEKYKEEEEKEKEEKERPIRTLGAFQRVLVKKGSVKKAELCVKLNEVLCWEPGPEPELSDGEGGGRDENGGYYCPYSVGDSLKVLVGSSSQVCELVSKAITL